MGPTLLELQTIASTTTTKAALLFTWGATGRIPGSLVTAFTFGKCSPLILLAGSVLLIAMCTCLLPWCHQYIVMATIVGLQGFGIGSLGGGEEIPWETLKKPLPWINKVPAFSSSGCTAYCFRLWQSRAAPFVQALTFTIALGNTCAPLLAQPFLMQSSAETMSSHLNTTPHPYNLGSTPSLDIAMGNITHQEAASKTLDYMTLELRNHSDTVSQVDFHIIGPRSNVTNRPGTGSYREIPRIAPLYLIISSLHLLSTVLYVVLYVKDRIQVEMEVSVKETFSSKVPLSDTKPQSILLCVLFGAFMLCCAGLEVTYGGLLFTYVVEHLAWHESAAAYLNFAYWIFLASGRGLGVVLVRFLTPRCIVIMDLIGACSAMLTLAVFSRYHVLVEWLCSCVLGLSLSTLVATTLNLAYSYLCLSGRLASIFMCCNYAGIMVFPGLTGALFRRVHGHCFVFACLTLAFLMVAIFAIIQVYYIKMRGISRKKTVRSEISADEKSTVIISFEEHWSVFFTCCWICIMLHVYLSIQCIINFSITHLEDCKNWRHDWCSYMIPVQISQKAPLGAVGCCYHWKCFNNLA